MKTSPALPRRDWLKLVTLGGAASIFPQAASAEAPAKKKIRGVIFMVSDGMSPGVLTMAEAFSRQTRKRSTAWRALLEDRKAVCGLMDTASANSSVTDSAAAASAWGGGQRVNNGAINVLPDGTELTPVFRILKKKGLLTGLVTTATVTHATPAGFAAVQGKRNDEGQIALQYLNGVDVILGGGAGFFDPEKREDRRDLIKEFAASGYAVVDHRAALLSTPQEKLLGLFYGGHLPFALDRMHDQQLAEKIPALAEMTESALQRFLASGKSFLLQVEGARIDHAAHLNDIAGLLHEQLAFDDAVAKAIEMIGPREDILLVVTSDHGNSNPGIVGVGKAYDESDSAFEKIASHTASHEWLFQKWKAAPSTPAELTNLIDTHLKYRLEADQAEALAAILEKRSVVEWNNQLHKPEGLLGQFTGNHVGVGWNGTTHTSDPTLISARGPEAERFRGMVMNTDIFKHLVEMLG